MKVSERKDKNGKIFREYTISSPDSEEAITVSFTRCPNHNEDRGNMMMDIKIKDNLTTVESCLFFHEKEAQALAEVIGRYKTCQLCPACGDLTPEQEEMCKR